MPSKVKILHFITDSNDHEYLYNVTDNTDSSNFEIFVASLNPTGNLQKAYRKKGIETLSFDTVSRKEFPKAIFQLKTWLRQNKIDIIQTHLYDASIVGLLAAKLAGTPLKILTGHHSHEMPFYKGKPTFWVEWLSSRFLADHFIAPSEQMREVFIECEGVPEKKIAVVHHGFDLSKLKHSETGRERIRKEFDLEDKVVFGAVGKIFWIKDFPTLIKAFAPIAKADANNVLMIVGEGDQGELLELTKELSVEDQVIFTGRRSDMVDLFSAMDVFVHPSLAESFGLVIAEAMAMGKPLICTDVGIAREIIKDGKNGFIVPVGDEKKLGVAMKSILSKRGNWEEMGKLNHETVQHFTAEKMAEGYKECYLRWLEVRRD